MVQKVAPVFLRYFYFAMSVLVLAIVLLGFGRNIDSRLIHPAAPRPFILFIHATVFSGWVLLFMVQSFFVRSSRVALHRKLGMASAAIGVILPLLGLGTAIFMHNIAPPVDPAETASFSVSLNDMLTFAVAFWCAIAWRRRPEFHKRAMLMASASLLAAAFARFPAGWVPELGWYGYVDALVVFGVLRDLVVERRVHVVYLVGLPCMIAAQALALYLMLQAPAAWLTFLHLFLA